MNLNENNEESRCRREAFKLLALKGRLTKELKEKLKLKKFSLQIIEKILKECEQKGYLNDQEEGTRLAKRWQRKGYGSALIAYKMEAKGAPFDPAQLEDPQVIIRQLLEKKYRNHSREKILVALQRRGFDYSSILDALNSQDSYKKGKG